MVALCDAGIALDADTLCRAAAPLSETVGLVLALKAGERKVVTLTYKPDTFATWDETKHGFTLFPGEEKVEVGASSEDIRLTGTLTVR